MIQPRRFPRLFVTACTTIALASCKPSSEAPRNVPQQTGDTAMNLTIQSPAFENNTVIPQRFTGDGEDVSPELSWSGLPEGAKELALIMDDPDAPMPEPWVHWVIYKIPATATGLPEGVAKDATLTIPQGALQGVNSWGSDDIGYRGPAPPPGHGVHHYYFKVYALDTALNVEPRLTKTQLLSAMEGHILAQGELVGTYQR